MNFIKVSCLITQAQCLTNLGRLKHIYMLNLLTMVYYIIRVQCFTMYIFFYFHVYIFIKVSSSNIVIKCYEKPLNVHYCY